MSYSRTLAVLKQGKSSLENRVAVAACLGALFTLGCGDDDHPLNVCPTSARTAWDSPRLLLDCLKVDSFSITPELTAEGKVAVPARYSFEAPDESALVVCAAFVGVPLFDRNGITNFDKIAARYSIRSFASTDAKKGTFDVALADRHDVSCKRWKVAGVGCIAYSPSALIAATALVDVSFAGVQESCADDRCLAGNRRLGLQVDDVCKAYCTPDTADTCTCDEQELCTPRFPEGGTAP